MASTTITDTLNPLAFKQEFVPLVRALRNLLRTLWSTKGRQTLTLLTVAPVIVVVVRAEGVRVDVAAVVAPFVGPCVTAFVAAFVVAFVVVVVVVVIVCGATNDGAAVLAGV